MKIGARLFLLLTILLTSCTLKRDFPVYQYQEYSSLKPFTISFPDSTKTYNIELSCRLPDSYEEPFLPLTIYYTSPSGQTFVDIANLPIERSKISNAKYLDINWDYRKGIVPKEKGNWTMSFTNDYAHNSIIGIGVKVYPNNNE